MENVIEPVHIDPGKVESELAAIRLQKQYELEAEAAGDRERADIHMGIAATHVSILEDILYVAATEYLEMRYPGGLVDHHFVSDHCGEPYQQIERVVSRYLDPRTHDVKSYVRVMEQIYDGMFGF